jgi:tetratricopeptide (TPR) repeat protein
MRSRARVVIGAGALIVASRGAAGQCAPATQRLIDGRKYDEARAILARTSNDDQAVHCLGRISATQNRHREALGFFERAAKLNDKSSLHHLWIGNSLGDLADSTGKLKLPFLARRVKSEFERAVELDPRNLDARQGLVQFYLQAPGVMGGSEDKAKEQAREIARYNPMRGHFEMARVLTHQKKMGEVEQELVAADKEFPDSARASSALTTFYFNEQKWPELFATYDRMARKSPFDTSLHYSIGRAAASGQQLERGEKEMKAWLAAPATGPNQPTVPNGRWRLGMIYEKQGKKDLARAEYNTALSLDPKNPNAKKSLEALR